MSLTRALIIAALALILGIPFLLRPASHARALPPEQTVIIVTPHVPQIRTEFAAAFGEWHRRKYGTAAGVDWRVPGGTSDIMAQLQAMYSAQGQKILAELARTDPTRLADPKLSLNDLIPAKSMTQDLFFGGGSFDHGRVKNPRTASLWVRPFPAGGVEDAVLGPLGKGDNPAEIAKAKAVTLPMAVGGRTLTVRIPEAALVDGRGVLGGFASSPTVSTRINLALVEREVPLSMSEPAGFSAEQMKAWFGENLVGSQTLYDPEQYWIGTALSGFGIVFNKDLLSRLGVPNPTRFDDLADPRLFGMVILADPRQSGSVATTLDAILGSYGWEKGWALIREMCGNARTFSNSSPKPPIDISAGEAAMGLAIDFYGRGQSQAVLAPGQAPEESRVGYVDPQGAAYIDADPVTILRGCPHPELARHFVEFCLSEEGQALWQFPARSDPRSKDNPRGEDGEPMGPQQNELRRMPVRRVMYEKYTAHFIDKANPFEIASKNKAAGWRDGIGIMMGAFAIDNSHQQREAWQALFTARADASFPKEVLAQMETLYFSFPTTTVPDGSTLPYTQANFAAIARAWKKDAAFKTRCEIDYTEFFRANYREIVRLAKAHARAQ